MPGPLKSVPLFFSVVALAFACNKASDPSKPSTPVITNLSATLGEVGKVIMISGTNFSDNLTDNTVTFNGTVATITSANSILLIVNVPVGATTGPVAVTVKGVTTTGPNFTVYVPGIVTSITPISGPAGTIVTITGTGFETDAANLKVSFIINGTDLSSVLSASATQITVAVPSNVPNNLAVINVKAFGTEPLIVSGQGDQSNFWLGNPNNNGSPISFSVQPYTITGFSPASGAHNSSVVINGKGFGTDLNAYNVYFMMASTTITKAVVTSVTDTQITVTVPVNAITGPISVGLAVNNTGYCYSHEAFVVTP